MPPPPDSLGTREEVQVGAALFAANCGHCHANLPRAPVPDLRRSGLLHDEGAFQGVVRGGVLQARGMPRWDDLLSEADVHRIRVWLIAVARDAFQIESRQGMNTAPPERTGVVSGHP